MRYFYAFEHQYGSNIIDGVGHLIGRLLRFQSLRDRDRWVRGGPYGITDHFYRQAVSSHHPVVRRWKGEPTDA